MSKHAFKIGDTVLKKQNDCNSAVSGHKYVVQISRNPSSSGIGIGADPDNLCHCTNEWELVTASNQVKNMNLIEKAKLAFKGEPEKSFIKVGVMDSNENLTTEGQSLFMTYLLKKHGADFKKEVVDPILAEDEAK